MEEQFILRVPPSVAERIDQLLSENPSSSDSLDLSFSENGRTGTFAIGNNQFPASLLDLPAVVESYKTYDDNVLIKTADISQIIMVRQEGDAADAVEYKHGLTPPMRDARKRRFRREPDLNPELVQRVEKDLMNIIAGGTAENMEIEAPEQEENGDAHAADTSMKSAPPHKPKPVETQRGGNAAEPDRSSTDESDDSM